MSSSKTKKTTKTASSRGGASLILGYSIFWLLVFYLAYRYFNRKKKDTSEEYFGNVHAEREAYLQAVNSSTEVDENTLRRLLLRRAMTDIRRLWKLQADRESIYSLMRSSALEESVWQSFKAAESGIQQEILRVQAEAETFKEGWSETILKEAVLLCQREDTLNALMKDKEREEKKKSKTITATQTVKTTPSPIESSVTSSKSTVKVIDEKDDNSP